MRKITTQELGEWCLAAVMVILFILWGVCLFADAYSKEKARVIMEDRLRRLEQRDSR